jgi:uncharacterized protein (TIGR02284 family)
MLASDKKPLDILNNLLVINNERIEGYNFAAEQTDISVLQVLFSRLTETSLACKEELCKEVYKLGGRPPQDADGPGDFNKAWGEIKTALEKNDHKAILTSCYLEEFMAMKSYEYALRYYSDHLTTQHNQLFYKQKERLKEDHDRVKNLCDLLNKC